MPADIIDRAIAKAVGGADATQLDEIVYEGYGPGGTAVMVEAMTDNRNRTVAEMRNLFDAQRRQPRRVRLRRLAVQHARRDHP